MLVSDGWRIGILTVVRGVLRYRLLRTTVRSTEITIDSTNGHHRKRTLDGSPERLYQKNIPLCFPGRRLR